MTNMRAQFNQFLTRGARYKVVVPHAICVKVQRAYKGDDVPILAELLDISSSGARICCNEPVGENDELTISATPCDLPNSFTVGGVVCWTTLGSKGRFYAGCSIEPIIPSCVLDDLAKAGILERRQEVRQDTSVTLPARWEMDRVQGEATILNISRGGISLLMPQPGIVGHRICLTVTNGDQKPTYVFVKARWQVNTDEGSFIGCEISDNATFRQLAPRACTLCS